MTRFFTTVCVLACTFMPNTKVLADSSAVQSPDSRILFSLEIEDGALMYSLSRDEEWIVAPSKLEIIADGKATWIGKTGRENDTSWSPVYGQFSTIRDQHREMTMELSVDGVPVNLQFRAFNTGVGMRFVLPEGSAGKKLSYLSEYRILNSDAHFAGQRGSRVKDITKAKKVSVPLVTRRKDGLHIGFLESDLYSADGFELMRIRHQQESEAITATSSIKSAAAGQVTPWRVILIGDTAGDLTTNTVALNLAAPCKLEDTSWIKPGKGLWDWRIHGYNNGEFTYDINTRSYLHLIDFCAEHGLEYFTVDDFWFTKAGDGQMEVSPDVDIEKVTAYAKEKGVMIMLYYDRKKGNFGDETLFKHYANLQASGMKYGFMGNRADFTRNAINAAADNRLLINFHDGPVPMAGVERTMPNLIAREYCHGQQDSRKAFTPETFLQMAMVAGLSGPLDMSNGNFGIGSINAGERKKGPRKNNSYISTVVSEVARSLVIYTGLVTLPDAPEEYLKKADLFEFLKQMPSTWDETRVPHSEIAGFICVARRSGADWFVGSVNNQTERTLPIKLDFLEPDKPYSVTIFQDADDSHGVENPEAYEIKTYTLTSEDVIDAKMAFGGGHAMILRPVERGSSE